MLIMLILNPLNFAWLSRTHAFFYLAGWFYIIFWEEQNGQEQIDRGISISFSTVIVLFAATNCFVSELSSYADYVL